MIILPQIKASVKTFEKETCEYWPNLTRTECAVYTLPFYCDIFPFILLKKPLTIIAENAQTQRRGKYEELIRWRKITDGSGRRYFCARRTLSMI